MQAYFIERNVFSQHEQRFSFCSKSCTRPWLWSWPPQFRRLPGFGLCITLLLICFASIPTRLEAQTFSGEMSQGTADTRNVESEARIQILTRPIGALVFLEGEYSMAGRTPYTISHHLKGVYHIRATKPGYENWSTDYVFNGHDDDKLTIKLQPKTRFKAIRRSAMLPGSGQCYTDQKTKGFLISLAQFSSAGISLYQHFRYTEALNDYNTALKKYEANKLVQENQEVLIAEVSARKAEADNAFETRKRWLLITASIYAYNLLDAFLFFPSYHNEALDVSLTLEPTAAQRAAVGVKVQAKF